jgi:hypothetical protein
MAKKSATSDAELLAQLAAAEERGEAVEAVVTLRPDEAADSVPVEQIDRISRDVVERVERKIGVSPERVNVFRNLGSFAVAADPRFVKELLAQPEVETAIANRRGEPVVEPLGRPADEGDSG